MSIDVTNVMTLHGITKVGDFYNGGLWGNFSSFIGSKLIKMNSSWLIFMVLEDIYTNYSYYTTVTLPPIRVTMSFRLGYGE